MSRILFLLALLLITSAQPSLTRAQSQDEICADAWATLDYLEFRSAQLRALRESNQRFSALYEQHPRPSTEAWLASVRAELAARDTIVSAVMSTVPPLPYTASHEKLSESFQIAYAAEVQRLESTVYADGIRDASEITRLRQLSDESVRLTQASLAAIGAALDLDPPLPSDEELEPCRSSRPYGVISRVTAPWPFSDAEYPTFAPVAAVIW